MSTNLRVNRIWGLHVTIDWYWYIFSHFICRALAFVNKAAADTQQSQTTQTTNTHSHTLLHRSALHLQHLQLRFVSAHCRVHSIASTCPVGQTARLNRQRGGGAEEGGHCSLSSLSFCLLPLRLNTSAHMSPHWRVHARTPGREPLRTVCKFCARLISQRSPPQTRGKGCSSERWSAFYVSVFLLSV